MGSGGSFGDFDYDEFSRKKREAEENSKDNQFETEVNAEIKEFLKDVNARDIEKISKHIESVRKALESEIDGTIDVLFGGSVSKNTFLDGISDVDSLVILNDSELEGLSPNQVLDYFIGKLEQRLPKTEIKKGNLAVTLKFHDIELQLLPAIKHLDRFKIASSLDNSKWSEINPQRFSKKLTQVNQENNNMVVPTIKIIKAIISDLTKSRQLSGYHSEALAVKVFQNYKGELSLKAMIDHFFNTAPTHVLTPIVDKTGQSIHVDDYLGPANSIERKAISDSLNTISRKINLANKRKSIRDWQDLLQ